MSRILAIIFIGIALSLSSFASLETNHPPQSPPDFDHRVIEEIKVVDYALDYKILVDPLPLMAGILNVEMSIPLSNSWSFDFRGIHWIPLGGWLPNFSVTGLGIKSTYHFGQNINENSLFLGLGADFFAGTVTEAGAQAAPLGVLPNVNFGYQWVKDEFVVRAGVGYSAITPVLHGSLGFHF